MTFGFSRDGIGGFLPDDLDREILPVDPLILRSSRFLIH